VGEDVPEWVESLCKLPLRFRAGGVSIRELVEGSAPDLADLQNATNLIRRRLAEEPRLVDEWQTYSYDKRSSPSPYLDGREVGYFDGVRREVATHDDQLDACADFIVREARSVLGRT
jgi:hypothetical protein